MDLTHAKRIVAYLLDKNKRDLESGLVTFEEFQLAQTRAYAMVYQPQQNLLAPTAAR